MYKYKMKGAYQKRHYRVSYTDKVHSKGVQQDFGAKKGEIVGAIEEKINNEATACSAKSTKLLQIKEGN